MCACASWTEERERLDYRDAGWLAGFVPFLRGLAGAWGVLFLLCERNKHGEEKN